LGGEFLKTVPHEVSVTLTKSAGSVLGNTAAGTIGLVVDDDG